MRKIAIAVVFCAITSVVSFLDAQQIGALTGITSYSPLDEKQALRTMSGWYWCKRYVKGTTNTLLFRGIKNEIDSTRKIMISFLSGDTCVLNVAPYQTITPFPVMNNIIIDSITWVWTLFYQVK